MTTKQFNRLISFNDAQRKHLEHRNTIQGRRSVKGKAKGVGQVLAKSRVHEQVSMERVFMTVR